MNIESAFGSIYGRAPSPEETSKFNRIAKELGIRDNDAIWAVAFLLGHYIDLAKRMPTEIEKRAAESVRAYSRLLDQKREAAQTELSLVKSRIEENISRTVVESAQREISAAAQKVARHTARKSWLQWLGGAVVAGMLLVAGAFCWGYKTGNACGYARAVDMKLAANWSVTDSGQAAYRLYQSGDLRSILDCDRDGWQKQRSRDGKRKLCVVHPASDGTIVGWVIP